MGRAPALEPRARAANVWAGLVVAVHLTACPIDEPEPYYDDTIDVEAIPVEPGEMAGTFALKMQITTQTEIPAYGTATGGGDTYLLVERTWSEEDGYAQTQQVCGGDIKSETSTSTLPLESWQAIPAVAPKALEIRDDDGFFELDGHLELWGLEGFDDPYEDALPEDEVEAAEAPHKDRIVDMDEDGNDGMTINVDGAFASGDFYFIQRKVSDLRGVLRGPDEIFGLNVTSFEQVILGNGQGAPVRQGFPSEPHPDPQQSWMQEIRIEDGAGCDEVLAAIDDERLSRFKPF